MMAPRRGGNNHQQNGQNGNPVFANFNLGLNLARLDPATLSPESFKCACPTECLHENSVSSNYSSAIGLLDDVVRVVCNNENCTMGQYMHRECFENWEDTVLVYLKSCGRARSWSDRQRHQNLWTKKGYDLAFKACGCRCNRGHLKKDLDWIPPGGPNRFEDPGEVKKKRNRNKNRGRNNNSHAENNRMRTASISGCSSNGTVSPPVSQEHSSPRHSHCTKKKIAKIELTPERMRNGSAGNGIFFRRENFSAFNILPATKINSNHIKTEDDDNKGNDQIRSTLLKNLAEMNVNVVYCVLCNSSLDVFDRYPLINGTFFLSPRQHSRVCLEVKIGNRAQFLAAVCLFCLEGKGAGRRLTCMYCAKHWDGSALMLGNLYFYDIFAARPCCSERYRCQNCRKVVPSKTPLTFAQHSHSHQCPHCNVYDTHFVKSLSHCYQPLQT